MLSTAVLDSVSYAFSYELADLLRCTADKFVFYFDLTLLVLIRQVPSSSRSENIVLPTL